MSPLWHTRCPQHCAPSHSSPPSPPPPSWPSLHQKDRWVSNGACWLVPSDQLPLISCPSSSPPPSISTHMAPTTKGCDSCTEYRLRFKNKSCHAGRCIPLSQKDNKETHKHPAVTLTCTTGDPERSVCIGYWVCLLQPHSSCRSLCPAVMRFNDNKTKQTSKQKNRFVAIEFIPETWSECF